MAKYAISIEGIESLEKLRNELIQAENNLEDAVNKLYTTVSAVDEGLGIFSNEILLCLKEAGGALMVGREGMGYLAYTLIPTLQAKIADELTILGGSGDDENPPAQPRRTRTLW